MWVPATFAAPVRLRGPPKMGPTCGALVAAPASGKLPARCAEQRCASCADASKSEGFSAAARPPATSAIMHLNFPCFGVQGAGDRSHCPLEPARALEMRAGKQVSAPKVCISLPGPHPSRAAAAGRCRGALTALNERCQGVHQPAWPASKPKLPACEAQGARVLGAQLPAAAQLGVPDNRLGRDISQVPPAAGSLCSSAKEARCWVPSSQLPTGGAVLGSQPDRLGRDRSPRSAPLQQPKLGFAALLKCFLGSLFVGPSHLRSSCAAAWASQDGPDVWGARCRARLREAASAVCCPALRLMCRCKHL